VEPDPERVERPFTHAAAMADLADRQLAGGDRHHLISPCRAKIGAERPVDEQDVEPKEAEHRPRADAEEQHSGDEAENPDAQHQNQKAGPAQRAVRGDDGRKDFGFGESVVVTPAVVVIHGADYTGNMARKTTRQRLRAARKGKAAGVKGCPVQSKADAEAVHGELPQWTNAEIAEAFRRFAAANPTPRGELQHINPFTLLVAVVLSAQATDAGVNKAT